MKNLVIGTLSALIGGCTTWVVRDILNKRLNDEKDASLSIDDSFKHLVIINTVPDQFQREEFIKRYIASVEDLCKADAIDEVIDASKNISSIMEEVFDYLQSYEYYGNDDSELSDEESLLVKTLSEDVETSETVDIINNVEVIANGEENGEEENGEVISEESSKDVSEEFYEVEPEANIEEEQPEESKPSVQPQEDVQVGDESVEEEATESEEETSAIEETIDDVESDVDEKLFSHLIKELVNPIIENFGDEYEDRLVKMVDILSRKSTEEEVYKTYITRLTNIWLQKGERGKRKLNETISNFFSMYPAGSDTEE